MNQQIGSYEIISKERKDPYLKIRYAQGVGDVVGCILHSKAFGWLTKIITGQSKPCQKCSKRGYALNVLFPIPFWRLFFRTKEEYVKTFTEDLQKSGYKVVADPQNKSMVASKVKRNSIIENQLVNTTTLIDKKIEGFKMIAQSDNNVGEFLIRTQIFKK